MFDDDKKTATIGVMLLDHVSVSVALNPQPVQRLRSKNRFFYSMKIAICLAGNMNSMVHQQMQSHWLHVLQPLLSVAHVDIFAHVNDASRVKLPFSQVSIYKSQKNEYYVHDRIHGCSQPPRSMRVCYGINIAKKWQGCYAEILNMEAKMREQYEIVIRTRPDIEYGAIVPPISEWSILRNDTVWVMIAKKTAKKTAKTCNPGYGGGHLHNQIESSLSGNLFYRRQHGYHT